MSTSFADTISRKDDNKSNLMTVCDENDIIESGALLGRQSF
jgi:hypothetical protein